MFTRGLTNGVVADISADMWEYIVYEANRRGLDYASVYQEELDGRRQLEAEPFTESELLAIASSSRLNPRLLEGDETCPF